jgi:hypothetical protein
MRKGQLQYAGLPEQLAPRAAAFEAGTRTYSLDRFSVRFSQRRSSGIRASGEGLAAGAIHLAEGNVAHPRASTINNESAKTVLSGFWWAQ